MDKYTIFLFLCFLSSIYQYIQRAIKINRNKLFNGISAHATIKHKQMNMKHNHTIRLNEKELQKLIHSTVKRILQEEEAEEQQQKQDEIIDATNTIADFAVDTLKSLGIKALPLLYCINQKYSGGLTSIDYEAVRDTITNRINYERDIDIANDADAAHDIIELANRIKKGDFGPYKQSN